MDKNFPSSHRFLKVVEKSSTLYNLIMGQAASPFIDWAIE
jgi:hypothetical protein